MADYHAVLQRTLSGFSDPKPQLRTKLYERARVTIKRQLEGRTPALSSDAMAAEMDKLEGAITQIEQGFDPSYAGPVLEAAPSPAFTPPPGPDLTAVPPLPTGAEPAPAPTVPAGIDLPEAPSVGAQETPTLPPVPEFVPPPEPAPVDVPPAPEPSATVETDGGVVSDAPSAPSAPTFDPLSELAIPSAPVPPTEPVAPAGFDPAVLETPAPAAVPPVEETIAPELPQKAEPDVGAASPAAEVDPLDQWAKEFMGAQETAAPALEPQAVEPALDPVPEPAVEPAPEPNPKAAPRPAPTENFNLPPIPDFDPVPVDHTANAAPTVDAQPPMQASLDPFAVDPAPSVSPVDASVGGAQLDGTVLPQTADPAPIDFGAPQTARPVDPVDDGLAIPPAPGFGEPLPERRRKGGFFKWLLLLIILAALAVAGWYGWTNRDQLMEQFGLADNGVRPTPVRTITIKPEPAEPTETQPEVGEAQTDGAGSDEPKAEDRLTPDGNGGAISTEPVEPTLPPTVTVPGATSDPQAGTTEPSTTPGQSGLPVSQNAILYEEGASPTDNTVIPGRVIWSVVQEEPAAGQPKEAAIRGRVEVPDRSLVLIMTIKRNSDQALPASHLIELVFAVPDDFAGGSIGEINRFVMKESEQGRGEGLVAVPARIADGIFLIALNNLPEAVTTNTNLLRDRPWIDIPLQYRTGRRALVTIEKGAPGEKVFKEVFEAWGTPAAAQ
ncbi:MAG: hypothetical protein AAFO61_10285 [Pseudomonadota bacterium]